jgi:DNA-binding NarL/FixJ family response regulator
MVQAPRTLLVGADVDEAATALAGAGIEPVARTADEIARLLAAVNPDLVVTATAADTGAVLAAAPDVPVLALVGAGDHASVLAVVEAGATSVVVHPDELPDAARRTAEGATVFSPGLADLVLASVSPGAEDPTRLTDRETDVLRLVVDGLTAKQIASRLVLSQRTVENHVQNMLRKLRLTGRAALVRYAIENGLA